MKIRIVYALPDVAQDLEIELGDGATVADALRVAASREPFSGLPLDQMPVGVFGEPVERARVLSDGDRVELYRPLEVDPMARRRARSSDS